MAEPGPVDQVLPLRLEDLAPPHESFSFPRYLLAKQSLDDRSLSQPVLEALKAELPPGPLRILEAGAGVGTMLVRLLRWKMLAHAEYVAVDELAENIQHALAWIPQWATENGIRAQSDHEKHLRLWNATIDVRIIFERAEVVDFALRNSSRYDLLIAHAVLDLLPMPESLCALLGTLRPGGLGWLTLNFDSVTTFEPQVDAGLDALIERLYHASMDTRSTGGDSRTGRHLFSHLHTSGAQILAAGASDWVVYPGVAGYPAEERYFLNFILGFFEHSLKGHPELDPQAFAAWLTKRYAQVERAELTYIAHQMDFLTRV